MTLENKKVKVFLAFAAIYLIWGSTYLAIRVGLETVPPFFLGAARFLMAGCTLYAWLRLRGVAKPTMAQWRWALATGALMLVGGAGGVTWAEQRIPSGVASLLIATVPLWMTIIEAAVWRTRIGWRVALGLGLGMAGVAVLLSPTSREMYQVNLIGAIVIVLAALSWSLGSLASRRANLPTSPAMTVATQMITAGAALLAISGSLGEWKTDLMSRLVAPQSIAAVLYLTVFGSIVGLVAYVWLLRQVSAAAVSTYAFVNPMVAVSLGGLVAGEPMGTEVFVAAALIISAVVLIQSTAWRRREPAEASRIGSTPKVPVAIAVNERRCRDTAI
jgi:drug/metabolite transporter (DMT)-like permease